MELLWFANTLNFLFYFDTYVISVSEYPFTEVLTICIYVFIWILDVHIESSYPAFSNTFHHNELFYPTFIIFFSSNYDGKTLTRLTPTGTWHNDNVIMAS